MTLISEPRKMVFAGTAGRAYIYYYARGINVNSIADVISGENSKQFLACSVSSLAEM
ncbi:MAG: hypothetical protein IPG78_08360 [Ignavibacteria bacterium]|nr:hypothetical protein [Ignavibacteria bacterium]